MAENKDFPVLQGLGCIRLDTLREFGFGSVPMKGLNST